MNLIILKIIAIIIFFILGLYHYVNYNKNYENMDNMDNMNNMDNNSHNNNRCPNMLIEKDGAIFLFNSKLAIVPGVNPIQFNNLEEYSEFVQWQNSQNIHCPVLYLQYTTDAQNNDLLQIKPSVFENQGGLPSTQSNTLATNSDEDYYEQNKILDATKDSNPKYNDGMYSGIDTHNQNIGLDTPLDKLFHESGEKSANPMDPNWAGKKFTQQKLEDGKYKGRYVYKHVI